MERALQWEAEAIDERMRAWVRTIVSSVVEAPGLTHAADEQYIAVLSDLIYFGIPMHIYGGTLGQLLMGLKYEDASLIQAVDAPAADGTSTASGFGSLASLLSISGILSQSVAGARSQARRQDRTIIATLKTLVQVLGRSLPPEAVMKLLLRQQSQRQTIKQVAAAVTFVNRFAFAVSGKYPHLSDRLVRRQLVRTSGSIKPVLSVFFVETMQDVLQDVGQLAMADPRIASLMSKIRLRATHQAVTLGRRYLPQALQRMLGLDQPHSQSTSHESMSTGSTAASERAVQTDNLEQRPAENANALICVRCSASPPWTPTKLRCQHIVCYMCYARTGEPLSCPSCGQETPLHRLERVHSWQGGDQSASDELDGILKRRRARVDVTRDSLDI